MEDTFQEFVLSSGGIGDCTEVVKLAWQTLVPADLIFILELERNPLSLALFMPASLVIYIWHS